MINEAAVDSTGSHVDVPYAREAAARSGASRAGRRALRAAAASWFVVAALGQAMFVLYVSVVTLRSIRCVTRGPNETADIHLKGWPEVLPVSRSYLHLFRQM